MKAGAIAPGDRFRSALFECITAAENAGSMPPPRTGKHLSPAQVALLGRWIDEAARYDAHWAYVTPRRPTLPQVQAIHWPRNAVDSFVLHRLEKEGLRPAAEADRRTLLRRVTLDLTGLPPTPAEMEAFVADASPDAYDKEVNRLLASPRYGERMAQPWLDLARFADTNGYRLDNHRDVWKYRDWVINALNANMPFDRFTIEQLAGDLLPNATVQQKVATGFHRNTMVNFGNGSDPRDYLSRAVMDRVDTTATVWLGSTLACAKCHDHRYDPFTQKDYYRLFAFFHNVPEKGLDGDRANPVPSIPVPSPQQQHRLDALRRQLARMESSDRRHEALKKSEGELLRAIPAAMIMEEMALPRVTRVLLRGDYLNEGEAVTAGVPTSLPPLPRGAAANRLGLARWLVAPDHPLTSRVAVNRCWQTFFGSGLVKTADDFGVRARPRRTPNCSTGWPANSSHASGT